MTTIAIETTAAPVAVTGAELFIPLNKLKQHPNNARKTPHSDTHRGDGPPCDLRRRGSLYGSVCYDLARSVYRGSRRLLRGCRVAGPACHREAGRDCGNREGRQWASVHVDYPHGNGLRRAYPHPVTLSEEDEAAYVAAQGEYDALTD